METKKLFYLTGKTAIVTGGAGGIGKTCCEMLVAFGAKVVVSDYNLETVRETSKAINDKRGKSIGHRLQRAGRRGACKPGR